MSNDSTIEVWEQTWQLKFRSETKASALDGYWHFCDWLDDHHSNDSFSFRFFMGFGHRTSELRHEQGQNYPWTEKQVSSEGSSHFVIPIEIDVAAPNQGLARLRLKGIEDAVRGLLNRNYPNLENWGLEALNGSSDVTHARFQLLPTSGDHMPSGTEESLQVDLLSILFPYAEQWFDTGDTGEVSENTTDAIKAFDTWLSLFPGTDGLTQAVTSLEVLAKLLPDVETNVQLWNWVIISTHHAMQGFMTQALVNTDKNRLLILENRYQMERALEKAGGDLSKEARIREKAAKAPLDFRLPPFLHLYWGIKEKDFMNQYVDSDVFSTNVQIDADVERLNELRNSFIHFEPRTTIYHDSLGFPTLIANCLAVTRFLAFESNNVHWHEIALRLRSETAFSRIDEQLKLIRDKYHDAVKLMNPETVGS